MSTQPPESPARCPSCGTEVDPAERFCEACGAPLTPAVPTEPAPTGETAVEWESPIELSQPVSRPAPAGAADLAAPSRPCTACGGVVGVDGYCETCGTKAPLPRDHIVEQPAAWVAASCDRGIRHHRNEDAVAVAAEAAAGSRAVLVVCDGVSTSEDSDVASLAAARAAREVLLAHQPAGLGVPASRAAALANSFAAAVESANAAVIASTDPDSVNAASCTFAAAVLEGSLLVIANVGDSRVYWVPDKGTGEALQLSRDDSVAQLRIDSGVPREEAENGPQAHAITKWLGRDSSDYSPFTATLDVSGPGWVLVCSDGLWNYVSEAYLMKTLVADETAAVGSDPLALAEALVAWANSQGGKDNITVALARVG